MITRRPRGYVGRNHETVGADIVSVLHILKLPAQVLGEEEAARLADVKPQGWYKIDLMLDLMEKLDARIGQFGLLRMGRTIFKQSIDGVARQRLRSGRDVVEAFDHLYHSTNRGTDIGGWRVLVFEPGYAELEKTTPHHCMMEQGILLEAFALVGCPVMITQTKCFREGADCCVYALTSSVTDARWSGATKPGA
jgi:hypothetical protein